MTHVLQGYGPILGAGLGNAFADTVAGIPEGKWAAIGVSTTPSTFVFHSHVTL